MLSEEFVRDKAWKICMRTGVSERQFVAALDKLTPEQKYDIGIMPIDEPKYKIKLFDADGNVYETTDYTRGVYLIHSADYSFKYVAASCAIEERWYYAVKYLKQNKYHSKLVQQAWNKYGILYIDILEECSRSVLNHVKRKWMNHYNLPTNKQYYNYNQTIQIPGYEDVYSYDKVLERRRENGWEYERGKYKRAAHYNDES